MGADPLKAVEPSDSDGRIKTEVLRGDGLGSTVVLTDEPGSVLQTYGFDALGALEDAPTEPEGNATAPLYPTDNLPLVLVQIQSFAPVYKRRHRCWFHG